MKLLVIDGNSLINRAFYGIKLLTTKDGQFTNGIYGFITMLNRIMEQEDPDGVAVAFDLKKPTFRHEMYSEYKAGRKGMPEELASQMPILKEWLSLMGYRVLSSEGYEADDILGTLAAGCERTHNPCIIATGDRDSLQLVSNSVTVLNTVTKMGRPEIILYDEAAIMEKYGVTPPQLIEVKALQGDASDHIPGVAGIGEKTALSLIAQYHDVDYIYEHLDELDIKDGVRNKLAAGRDSAFLSRKLGTICKTVPISDDPEDYRKGVCDREAVARLMARLEFFSLIKKMGFDEVAPQEENAVPENRTFTLFAHTGEVLRDNETDPKNTDETRLADEIYFDYEENTLTISRGYKIALLPLESKEALEILKSDRDKSIYNSKSAHRYCMQKGFSLKNVVFDSMLAGYLCSPAASGYQLDRLSKEYAVPVAEVVTAQKKETADDSEKEKKPLPSSALRGAEAALVSRQLLKECEKRALLELLKTVELPLSEVLAFMELQGFSVDVDGIRGMGKRLKEKISELQEEIYTLGQAEFNINSPKQLGTVLFETLGLPAKKKTKSGYSTNAEVLESLKNAHPIVPAILEYRKLSKLLSTYCEGLVAAADENGKIHSTLNQTETRTGRISSQEPNLQNIPVRTEEGRELRKYFIAPKGRVLLDADYSQIELRVLAHMANDARMIEAFHSGVDIHTVTAAQVFHMPESMVTPLMRSHAKAVNFGIVYGIGAFSLAKDIGVTRKEAADYINNYLATYSGVARFMDDVIKNAREDGFVTTLFGRRRYLPELSSSNAMIRAGGERIARNTPIQGTAADIIKIAMIRVYNRLKAEKLDAKLILQIHDELIVEAAEKDAEKAAAVLKEEMENAAKLRVPLTADTHSGKTWYDAKG